MEPPGGASPSGAGDPRPALQLPPATMPTPDNRPPLADLLDKLGGVPAAVMEQFGPPHYLPLAKMLDDAIADVEDQAQTTLNPTSTVERRDGNGTNQLVLFKRPALRVTSLSVETPILGYTRVYEPKEIKLYRMQGIVKVFTYKLAVEQALLQRVDYQTWGALFPPLPQAVLIHYSYGFPLYDAAENRTSLDGVTWEEGDLRDPEETNWLTNLREAAVAKAGANFLSKSAPLAVGLAQSVSFDGYSRTFNPAAFGAQAEAFEGRAKELLGRRKRMILASTIG